MPTESTIPDRCGHVENGESSTHEQTHPPQRPADARRNCPALTRMGHSIVKHMTILWPLGTSFFVFYLGVLAFFNLISENNNLFITDVLQRIPTSYLILSLLILHSFPILIAVGVYAGARARLEFDPISPDRMMMMAGKLTLATVLIFLIGSGVLPILPSVETMF